MGCHKPAAGSSGDSRAHAGAGKHSQQEGCFTSALGGTGYCKAPEKGRLCPQDSYFKWSFAEEPLTLAEPTDTAPVVVDDARSGECLVCLEEFHPPEDTDHALHPGA